MTRKQTLAELIAKVEAGDLNVQNRHWLVVLPPHTWDTAWAAYHMASLDAALALDRAIPTPNAVMSPEDMALILFGRDGARHWLLWKLKALHAQEADQ